MQLTLDGQGKRGTGILLNNESRNGRAFLLTAFHVIDLDDDGIISQAERNSILNGNNSFTFKYQTTSCNGNALDLAQYAFVNGAIVRAAYKPTDMALLELVGTIPVDVNYAGWNRATGTPSSGVIIHHPSGSHARIATSSNITLDSDNQLRARYGTGTVARGSSGAGFFNQNHQVIGQLLGSSKNPFSLWRDDCVGCPASWSCPFYI
jgi:hypothetical protein